MAKYTELLSEYIEEGGELPAIFDQIDGFKELFVAEYIDHEIGFETPTIFEIKLNQRANIVIPQYLKHKEELEAIATFILSPNKKRIKSGDIVHSKLGEHQYIHGGVDETVTNTKSGKIIKTDAGTSETTPGNTYQREWDLPLGAGEAAGSELNIAPTTVTRGNAEKSESSTGNTNTESYDNYKDTVQTIGKDVTDKDIYIDFSDTESYNDVTEEEIGLTATEALAIKQSLTESTGSPLQALLSEFKNLFMAVY